MSYELVVGLQVKDEQKYARYREAIAPLLRSHGGGFRYDFKIAEVLRNPEERPINRVFTIYFGSREEMVGFFAHPEYKNIKKEFFEDSVEETTILSEYERAEKAVPSTVVLLPGEGRQYPMGRISSVFKADGEETAGRYSVSEWWLEPNTKGPGIHSHEEDDLFYIIEGTMDIHLDGAWFEAPKGSFVLAPAGTKHDFENRSEGRAGLLNFSIPGNFEENMPAIAAWFKEHPPRNAR